MNLELARLSRDEPSGNFEYSATKDKWKSPDAAVYREMIMKQRPLNRLPKALLSVLSDEVQAESLRPIQIVKGGTHININFGTLIKIPTYRPNEYTNKVYQLMELMDLIKPASKGGCFCAQEQIDWIKIAGKTGFSKP